MKTFNRPKWEKWRLVPDVARWQAVALSLDIEPDDVASTRWDDREHLSEIHAEFHDRLFVTIKTHDLQPVAIDLGDSAGSTVNLKQFVMWAAKHWKTSPEFQQLAHEGNSGRVRLAEMSRESNIKLLLRAKFPGSNAPPPPGSNKKDSESWMQTQALREASIKEWRALPAESLQRMAEEVRMEKQQREQFLREARTPKTIAPELDYWKKRVEWELLDAVLILLRLEPRKGLGAYFKEVFHRHDGRMVNPQSYNAERDWSELLSGLDISDAARTVLTEVRDLRENARAATRRQLLSISVYEAVVPVEFFRWAKAQGYDIVPELSEQYLTEAPQKEKEESDEGGHSSLFAGGCTYVDSEFDDRIRLAQLGEPKSHWKRDVYWTLLQAAYLLLNHEPDPSVTSDNLPESIEEVYNALKNAVLLKRHEPEDAKGLTVYGAFDQHVGNARVKPAECVAWYRAHSGFDGEILAAPHDVLPDPRDVRISHLERQLADAQQQGVGNGAGQSRPRESDLKNKLKTARRIMLGMAMAKWNYEPGRVGQVATGSKMGSIYAAIASKLDKAPTADTIRDHLEAASGEMSDV